MTSPYLAWSVRSFISRPVAARHSPASIARIAELYAFDEQIRSQKFTAEDAKNAENSYRGKNLCGLRDLCGETKRIITMEIAGFDEAGRGALAGPVAVGCVHFPPVVFTASGGVVSGEGFTTPPRNAENSYKKEGFLGDLCGEMKRTTLNALAGLDDSKRVSAKKREALFPRITSISDWGIGYATPFEIDRIGIVPALTLAACRAYRAMRHPVDLLLLDRGLSLVGFTAEDAKAAENRCKKEKFLCDLSVLCGKYPPELSFTKGDSRSLHIAAASILAKVHRDRTMVRLNAQCPGYGLASNKGYGTPAHLAALGRLGPSSIHRRSFRVHQPSHRRDR